MLLLRALLVEREQAHQHLVVHLFRPEVAPGLLLARLPRHVVLVLALIWHATVIFEARETRGSLAQGCQAFRLGRPMFLCQAILDSGLKWPG